MTDFLTKMDIKFQDRVRAIQDRFTRMKLATGSGVAEFEDDFFDYVDDIQDVMHSSRERILAASKVVDGWVFETQENLETWRHQREVKKLQKEADKAQHYAEAAMDVALSAMDEAELAIARAMMTRSFAEHAQKEDAQTEGANCEIKTGDAA